MNQIAQLVIAKLVCLLIEGAVQALVADSARPELIHNEALDPAFYKCAQVKLHLRCRVEVLVHLGARPVAEHDDHVFAHKRPPNLAQKVSPFSSRLDVANLEEVALSLRWQHLVLYIKEIHYLLNIF